MSSITKPAFGATFKSAFSRREKGSPEKTQHNQISQILKKDPRMIRLMEDRYTPNIEIELSEGVDVDQAPSLTLNYDGFRTVIPMNVPENEIADRLSLELKHHAVIHLINDMRELDTLEPRIRISTHFKNAVLKHIPFNIDY